MKSIDEYVGHTRVEQDVPEEETEESAQRGGLGVLAVRVPVGLVNVMAESDLFDSFDEEWLVVAGCSLSLRSLGHLRAVVYARGFLIVLVTND